MQLPENLFWFESSQPEHKKCLPILQSGRQPFLVVRRNAQPYYALIPHLGILSQFAQKSKFFSPLLAQNVMRA